MPARRDEKGRFIKGSGSSGRGKEGVQDKDRGWLRILRSVRKAPSLRAKVGVQGPEGEAAREEGMTNVGLATIHEFGAPAANIPERSFLRSTFDEHAKTYQQELDRIASTVLSGEELYGEVLLLGEKYRADVIGKIRSDIPPPLADATVARKGGEATALIDTGQLLNSIRVVVEKAR